MINIAIVEDETKTQEQLKSYFDAYSLKTGEQFRIV